MGGSGEDRAVTLSRHIYPIPAMHLWKSRSQKIFPRCVLCSQKENLPAERIRQISFMVRKYPVVIKQAIPARPQNTLENIIEHLTVCGVLRLEDLSYLLRHLIPSCSHYLMGPLGIWGQKVLMDCTSGCKLIPSCFMLFLGLLPS